MNDELKSVITATEWWVDKISHPTSFDNGSNSRDGEMASLFAIMLASKSRANLRDDQIDNFRNVLKESIQKEIESHGVCSLTVDYGPEGVLGQVAVDTNVDGSLFPWKTHMSVTKDEVKVSEGYGKEYKTIYPIKGNVKNKKFNGKN